MSRFRSICRAMTAAGVVSLAIGFNGPASAQGYLPPQQKSQAPSAEENAPRPISPRAREDSRSGRDDNPGYGQPYSSSREARRETDPRYDDQGGPPSHPDSYSSNEILDAGGRFFGKVSEGMAKVVEYAFRRQGRPNGYILGDEAGGAIVAGLRYGEGTLHTKFAPPRKVYWQGPSVGYDFGGDGSKTLTLVYNIRDPRDIYERFGGVDGSAYFVGGVGITFQQHRDITLAPIRAGVGLRLGANIGYLKYTPAPTWNPF